MTIKLCILLLYFVIVVIFLIISYFEELYSLKQYECGGLDRTKTDKLRGLATAQILLGHVGYESYLTQGVEGVPWHFISFFLNGLGSTGVAIFFLLSGYGLSKSIYNKRMMESKKIDYSIWLIKKIGNLVLGFSLCFAVTVIFNFLMYDDWSVKAIVRDCFTLTIPYTSSWYLKVIILFYAILWISIMFVGDRWYYWLVLALTIVYIIALCVNKVEGKWWQTALCFSFGFLYAEFGERIRRVFGKRIPYFCAILMLGGYMIYFFVGSIKHPVFRISSFLLFAIGAVMLIETSKTFDNLPSTFLKAIGKYSLEIYLIHTGFLYILNMFSDDTLYNASLVIRFCLATIISVITVVEIKHSFIVLVRHKSEMNNL